MKLQWLAEQWGFWARSTSYGLVVLRSDPYYMLWLSTVLSVTLRISPHSKQLLVEMVRWITRKNCVRSP
jgi:hypothetical protein